MKGSLGDRISNSVQLSTAGSKRPEHVAVD
jgi:hypothetical protein